MTGLIIAEDKKADKESLEPLWHFLGVTSSRTVRTVSKFEHFLNTQTQFRWQNITKIVSLAIPDNTRPQSRREDSTLTFTEKIEFMVGGGVNERAKCEVWFICRNKYLYNYVL